MSNSRIAVPLREAAQNALATLDGITDTNPRDTAVFETPAEWITWAKSRARWAADALRSPVAQEIYAERILKQMLSAPESDGSERVATVYVYRLSDGRTQVRAPDIQDSEVVVEMLEEALRAMSEGSPVQIN